MPAISGGCRCGAIRYTLDVEQLPATYACHCLDCQTWSGSAFSQQTFVPEAALHVSGPLAVYEFITPGGNVSKQRVCSVCHARIFNSTSARPGLFVLRAGTLDQSDRLDVVAHIWTKRKQAWVTLPENVPAWPEAAPAEALANVVARNRDRS